MTTLKSVKQAPTAAALKAERERDKIQAVRDYEDENRARQANMVRLRSLRLAQECIESKAKMAPRPTQKKKAATHTSGATT